MQSPKAFTLVETVIVLTMFSTVIILILTAVNKYMSYLAQSRIQTIALNLTREGVEEMYQWRDTNWQRNSASPDTKIFCLNPFACTENNLSTGFFLLNQTSTGGGNYFTLSKIGTTTGSKMYEDMSNYIHEPSFQWDTIQNAKLTFSGNFTGDVTGSISEVMEREGTFYRLVKVNGIYNKRTENQQVAGNNLKTLSVPVELDFCVKTIFFAQNGVIGESEICSLMTNFKK